MFKKIIKKKDEFQIFLEETGLDHISNTLSSEEKDKLKSACYVGFSVDIKGKPSTGNLITFREKDKLVWLIPANLISRKEYKLALKILEEGLSPSACKEDLQQYYISYALLFEKIKDIENCNKYCYKAIYLNHSGTYAYERLIINHSKEKEYKKALDVCNIVLENKKIFSEPTWKLISEYANKRKEYFLKKLETTTGS